MRQRRIASDAPLRASTEGNIVAEGSDVPGMPKQSIRWACGMTALIGVGLCLLVRVLGITVGVQ